MEFVIVWSLPVLQCRQCGECELEVSRRRALIAFLPRLILRRNSKSFDTLRNRPVPHLSGLRTR